MTGGDRAYVLGSALTAAGLASDRAWVSALGIIAFIVGIRHDREHAASQRDGAEAEDLRDRDDTR